MKSKAPVALRLLHQFWGPGARLGGHRDRSASGRFRSPDRQAVFLASIGRHEVVALRCRLDLLQRLPGALGQDAVELLAGLQDLAGMDLDVRGLGPGAASGWWIMTLALGSEALALSASGQQKAPMLAAMPMHRVETSGLMNCMVS